MKRTIGLLAGFGLCFDQRPKGLSRRSFELLTARASTFDRVKRELGLHFNSSRLHDAFPLSLFTTLQQWIRSDHHRLPVRSSPTRLDSSHLISRSFAGAPPPYARIVKKVYPYNLRSVHVISKRHSGVCTGSRDDEKHADALLFLIADRYS